MSDMPRQDQSLLRVLGRLWRHLTPSRHFQFYLLLFLLIAASLAEVVSIGAVPPFLGVLIDPETVFHKPFIYNLAHSFGISEAGQLLLPLTIIFSIAAIISGLLRFTLLYAQTSLSHDVGADLSVDIYRRTLHQPYEMHLMLNSSEVIAGISTKANNVVHLALMPAFSILTSGVMLASILAILILIAPLVALLCIFGLSVIYAAVILIVKRKLVKASQSISIESSKTIKALQEGLGGIRDVLLDGTQEIYCNIYQKSDKALRSAYASVAIISGAPRFGVEALGVMLIAVLAYFQAGQNGGLAASIPVLGALALGVQRMLPTLQQGYAAWSSIHGFKDSLCDVLNLLDQPMLKHQEFNLDSYIPFSRQISIRNVSFRYQQNKTLVLKNVDLVISKGSSVGFIGETGGGKSTLLDIVMGLLEPSDGSLYIDDELISKKNNHCWQAHIAHVPQSIFLSDASIAENIAFGIPASSIDFDRVRLAAKKAQLSSIIDAWSDGYHTQVGERGVRLSGGQRQRIGIARALYKQADVIVFDEATSALDNETERAVMESIEKLGDEITILIVAHRLTTLSKCTKIVEIQKGMIEKIGSYQEIIASKFENGSKVT